MKSKARRVIEKWLKQQNVDRRPVYIAEGSVFLYPSRATQDTFHYVVVWLRRTMPAGKVVDEFACGCKGWYYSDKDECYHVRDLRSQVEAGKVKMA